MDKSHTHTDRRFALRCFWAPREDLSLHFSVPPPPQASLQTLWLASQILQLTSRPSSWPPGTLAGLQTLWLAFQTRLLASQTQLLASQTLWLPPSLLPGLPDSLANILRVFQTNGHIWMNRPFLRDLFVRDHRSIVLNVWGARVRFSVTSISHSTLIFIFMITTM